MDLIKYDQHFMVDEELLDRIASKCKYREIIEIGPGNGALTEKLLKKAKVTAIEIDPDRFKELKERLMDEIKSGRLKLVNDNVLDLKLEGKIIFSNLPYGVSEPFFYKLIKSSAEHVYLVTGSKFHKLLVGSDKLGFFRKTFFKIENYESVSKTAFEPQPRVNSYFFALHRKNNDDFFSELLKQLDKKLKNALVETYCRFFEESKKEAKARMEKLNIRDDVLTKKITGLSNQEFLEIMSLVNSEL